MAEKKIKIYSTFIRIWHWTQAFLIFTLMFTGFAVHGTHQIIHFDTAVKVHNAAGIALVVLAIIMFFYYITTGEWKQYKLDSMDIISQIEYYSSGILKGDSHPHKKTEISRLNPLQKITYLNFKVIILPIMGITGTMYLYQEYFSHLNLPLYVLDNVAIIHTIGAFVLIAFIIVHIYMTTTGHTITAHIKTMITGWEEVKKHEKET